MNNQSPLCVESICFSYAKKQILDQISFEIKPGSFTVLLGANGAGKTTLFSLITRLYSPSSGRIVIFGHDLNRDTQSALRKMGVVFQSQTLDRDLSIKQNLKYYASLYGISSKTTNRLLSEQFPLYLSECQLDQKIHQLSGGQKRRVELMRSLMHEPDLLLLDEPTVGLDITSRDAFIEHVRLLCKDNGIGVLWATHLVDEVGLDDQVVILHDSKIVANGQVDQILSAQQVDNIGEAYINVTQTNRSSPGTHNNQSGLNG